MKSTENHPAARQTTENLRGEIAFRKLLAQQHVTGEMLLPDYYCKDEHDAILAARIETTRRDMERLRSQGVELSPFVELGAERCHRALVLANDFEAAGIAVDISFDQLKTADHFAGLFGKPQLPLRVCCDVNHLPIRDNSVAFAFCYEFLHHFPAVRPILAQVRRILAGGTFHFSEEPYKRPRIALYKQRHKIYSRRSLRRSRVFRTLEKFISEPWSDELEHGIVENDRISVTEWMNALAIFDPREVTLASVGGRITSRLGDRIRLANRLNMLLGGGISGTCATEGSASAPVPARLTDLLLCPNCAAGAEGGCSANPPPLEPAGDSLTCPVCSMAYPVVDGVVLLLPFETFQALYPRFLPSRRNKTPPQPSVRSREVNVLATPDGLLMTEKGPWELFREGVNELPVDFKRDRVQPPLESRKFEE